MLCNTQCVLLSSHQISVHSVVYSWVALRAVVDLACVLLWCWWLSGVAAAAVVVVVVVDVVVSRRKVGALL